MPGSDLRQVLRDSAAAHVAVGHFNATEAIALKGIVEAARSLQVPVIIGVTERERAFLGTRQLAALVHSIREEHEVQLFLDADHTHTLSQAIEAAKAGFDAIVFDCSSHSLEENMRQTKTAVEAVKSINPSILVEGEIGDIGVGSRIHPNVPESCRILTTPDEARQFVDWTRVEMLAPAVGNMHGLTSAMANGHERKRLNIERIRQIKAATDIFLTLHGGSGTGDDDLQDAILAGINIVHINTEIRLAFRKGLERSLAENPDNIAPYELLQPAVQAVKEAAQARLRLFNTRAAANSLHEVEVAL